MVGVLPTSPYANAREDAERALEGAKATAAELMGRRQVDTLMINGSDAAGLADEAPNAEMIVIGTSGRHQISGVTLGSVASRLAGNLPCPLIVIRAARSDTVWDQHPIVVGVDGSHASDSALEFAFERPRAVGFRSSRCACGTTPCSTDTCGSMRCRSTGTLSTWTRTSP